MNALTIDVTPEGFGTIESEFEPTIEHRINGETLDQAIERKVGYQVDNGRVKIFQEGELWIAAISQIEGGVRKLKSYSRQTVLNLAFDELYPNTKIL